MPLSPRHDDPRLCKTIEGANVFYNRVAFLDYNLMFSESEIHGAPKKRMRAAKKFISQGEIFA